jgi:hypothetical protein
VIFAFLGFFFSLARLLILSQVQTPQDKRKSEDFFMLAALAMLVKYPV